MTGWQIIGAVLVAGLALRRFRHGGPIHRPNLEGFTDDTGQFHPIRASKDYSDYFDEERKFTRSERARQGKESAAERAEGLKLERDHLREALRNDPRRPLTKLMQTHGQMRGHV